MALQACVVSTTEVNGATEAVRWETMGAARERMAVGGPVCILFADSRRWAAPKTQRLSPLPEAERGCFPGTGTPGSRDPREVAPHSGLKLIFGDDDEWQAEPWSQNLHVLG